MYAPLVLDNRFRKGHVRPQVEASFMSLNPGPVPSQEPEHKVERNLAAGSRNLFTAHSSVRDKVRARAQQAGSQTTQACTALL